MRQRDRAILADLERFRVMSRDDIIDLHFSRHKQGVTCANNVLRRLSLQGYITSAQDRRPYLYFPAAKHIKKDSAKIPHFLSIVSFYKQVVQHAQPSIFQVEPKFGKGYPEPDVFMLFQGVPFFCEIQRTVFSATQIREKVNRYERYFDSNEWEKENWQGKRPVFPVVLMLTGTRYAVSSDHIRFLQADSFHTFIQKAERARTRQTAATKAKVIIHPNQVK